MPRPHDFLVDPVEDFRGEQHQVVLEGLQLVVALVRPVAVAEHQPKGGVLVGQLLDAVVVGVQPQPQHPEHEDAPLCHAGAPGGRAGLAFRADPLGEHFPQDGKHALAQFGVGVEVLQPPQQLRDVVAGLGVQPDVGDGDLAEFHLRVEHSAHKLFRVAKIFRGLPGLGGYQPVFSGKDGYDS